MKIEVKLYSYHDMDLVGLYKTGKISFPETTRQILNSYANKEVYKVKVLKTNEERLAKYPKESFRKYYHYHVMLDKKMDAAAISLLKKITPGYRNNFIKVVLRQYLCGVFLPEYFVDGDSRFFNEMSRRFQGDRDEREIRQTKKHGKSKDAAKSQISEDFKQNDSESLRSLEQNPPNTENKIKSEIEARVKSVEEVSNSNGDKSERGFTSGDDSKEIKSQKKKEKEMHLSGKVTSDNYGLKTDSSHAEVNVSEEVKKDQGRILEQTNNSEAKKDAEFKIGESAEEDEDTGGYDDFDDFLDGATEQY